MPPPLLGGEKKKQEIHSYQKAKLGMGFGGTEFSYCKLEEESRREMDFNISGALLGTCKAPPGDAPLLVLGVRWSRPLPRHSNPRHTKHGKEIFTVVLSH